MSYRGLANSAIVYGETEAGAAPALSVVSAPNGNILCREARTGSLVQQLKPEIAYGPEAGLSLRTLPVAYSGSQGS